MQSPISPLWSRASFRVILLILIAAALLPMVVAPIPGLADLPNHIARHHVLFHFGEGGPIDRYFDVHWRWIGNLGLDLPVLGLMHFMDAQMATRIAAAFIAPLMVVALLALSRAGHGRVSASAMLAMPLVFHQAYLYGFANYCLGVALGLLVLAAWLTRPPESWRGWLLYAALSVLVWTAHMGGWSILVVAAGCAELTRIRSGRDILKAAGRLWPLAMPLLPLLLWRGEATDTPLFGWAEQDILWAKTLNFLTVLKGWSRPADLAMTGMIGLLALLAFIWAGRRRLDARLFAAGIGICLMATLMPTTILGSWGADFRLAPMGVILLLLSIAPAADPRRERLIFAAGLALFLIRSVGIAVSWHRASQALEERLRLLDDVPRGSRMGFIAVQTDCAFPWEINPDRKLPGLAIARRDVFTNTMFKVDGADLMTIRAPQDRARWYDLSEDVAAICPDNRIDYPALSQRIEEMAQDRFTRIWIWGAPADRIPLPPGYRRMRAAGDDVLIGR
ncbi:MAG: hypothetical protein AB7E05_09100 [Sphingobium sp.]